MAAFCGPECQKEAWSEHKLDCRFVLLVYFSRVRKSSELHSNISNFVFNDKLKFKLISWDFVIFGFVLLNFIFNCNSIS